MSGAAALRQAGAIDADGDRKLVVTGPLPAGRTALEDAIHRAATEGWRWPLAQHAAVAPLVDPLPRRLRRDGWIVATPGRRGSFERGCLIWFAALVAFAWWIGVCVLIFAPDARRGHDVGHAGRGRALGRCGAVGDGPWFRRAISDGA